LKKLLLLIGVYFLFSPTYALANNCLDSSKSSNRACLQNYSYDVLVMYFKDNNDKEHKVRAKRIHEKSTGNFVHVDYDFESSCANDCSSLDLKVNDVLWSFRNTYMTNKFYEKVIYKCDPTEGSCCYDTGCTEILDISNPLDSADKSSDESRSLLEEANIINGNQFTQKRSNNKINGEKFDRALNRINGTTSVIDRVMRDSTNGQDVKQNLENVTAQPMLFITSRIDSGRTTVCAITGSGCKEVSGSATVGTDMANFDLQHNNGPTFNHNLQRFLVGVYQNDYGMHCDKTVKWNDADSVTITLRCIRR